MWPRWIGRRFHTLSFRKDVVDALNGLDIVRPTIVQKLIIPRISLLPTQQSKHHGLIFSAETGSGKTLTYLLPIINHIKNYESQTDQVGKHGRPKCLILVPTRELVLQVLSMAKALAHVIKFRVRGLIGGSGNSWIGGDVSGPLDIVITTPTMFKLAIDTAAPPPKANQDMKRMFSNRVGHGIFLSDLQWVVFDEVDAMVEGRGFMDELETQVVSPIMRLINSRAYLPLNIICTSATVGPNDLKNLFPEITMAYVATPKSPAKIISSSALLTSNIVRHDFIRVSPRDKLVGFTNIIKSLPDIRKPRIIIFCNTVASCRFIEYLLSDRNNENGIFGVDVSCLHSKLPSSLRDAAFRDFHTGVTNIMITTDLASRGIDFTSIDIIVNFDFPLTDKDYLHRSGRVARLWTRHGDSATHGVKGVVVSILASSKEYEIVKKLGLTQYIKNI